MRGFKSISGPKKSLAKDHPMLQLPPVAPSAKAAPAPAPVSPAGRPGLDVSAAAQAQAREDAVIRDTLREISIMRAQKTQQARVPSSNPVAAAKPVPASVPASVPAVNPIQPSGQVAPLAGPYPSPYRLDTTAQQGSEELYRVDTGIPPEILRQQLANPSPGFVLPDTATRSTAPGYGPLIGVLLVSGLAIAGVYWYDRKR